MSRFHEFDRYDALGLAELVKKGEIGAKELVEEAIARIEEKDDEINSVVYRRFEPALKEAEARDRAAKSGAQEGDRLFEGVPFLLKDLMQYIPDSPTGSGSRLLAGDRKPRETTFAKRLREAGLIVVGKAASSEFGLLPATETEAHGPTRNPWDLTRTPGGSSGGSAAAVATGFVPLASAGDGGGSIRIPAACCGLFGLKPSRGRSPLGPYAGQGWGGFAQELVISRSVRDTAAALDVISPHELGSPDAAPPLERPATEAIKEPTRPLRIAYHAQPFVDVPIDEVVLAALERSVALLRELGHELIPLEPGFKGNVLGHHFQKVVSANAAFEIIAAERALKKRAAPLIEGTSWVSKKLGEALSAVDYLESLSALHLEGRRLAQVYAEVDVVLTPTLGKLPLKIGEVRPSGFEGFAVEWLHRLDWGAPLGIVDSYEIAINNVFSFIPFTPVANFTGEPSMSFPLEQSPEGLPIGMMFTGKFGRELELLQLARQLEEARPFFDRRAPHAYASKPS